jgi:hypothetical protein
VRLWLGESSTTALTHHEHQQQRVAQILQVQQQLEQQKQVLALQVQQPLVELFRYQSLPSRRHE